MDLDFLKRVQRGTAVFGSLAFLMIAFYYDTTFALGYLVGCLWGIANFWALGRLLQAVFVPGPVDHPRAFLLVGIKFPLLYAGGGLILISEWFPAVSLLVGFVTIFLVMVLKAGGRAFLRLDDRTSRHGSLASAK